MEVPILIAMSLGVLFIPKVKEKIGGRLMLLSGTAIVGITYSIFSVLGHLPAYLLYPSLSINSFFLGLGAILISMPLQISLFTKIDREYFSRVASIMNALMLCATPLGSFIFGMISSVVSIKVLFFILGIIVVILSLTQTLSKSLKGLD